MKSEMARSNDSVYPFVFTADSPMLAMYRTLEMVLSSVPLVKAVDRQIFRQDLFFRLNLITIRVPPLRERRNEIFPMALFLLEQLDRKYRGKTTLHPDCSAIFQIHDFPGNIREL